MAKKLFQNVGSDWHGKQWTDHEINACKNLEMEKFIANPSIKTVGSGRKHLFTENFEMSEDTAIVDSKISKNVRSFLSVGCGMGEKEIALAKRHPKISFTAIDSAPHTEGLNNIVKELGINNLSFKQHDLRSGPIGKFDVVFSFAVIYCIPDDGLIKYFNSLKDSIFLNGRIFVGCSSNLSVVEIFKHPVRFILRKIYKKRLFGLKVTGWKRNISHIKARMPKDLMISAVTYQDHYHSSGIFYYLMSLISKHFYPINNASYLLELKNKV